MHILHTHVSQWIRTAVYVIDKLSLINLSVTFYWHSSYVSYYRLAHPINFRKCIRFINGLNSEFSYQSRCQSSKIIKEDQIYLDLETKYFIYLSLFLWVFWRNTTNGSSIQTLFLFLKFEFLPMDYVLLFPNMAADASLVEWITVRCECILNSL